MREERIFLKGVESNYKTAGEGMPLLILHGWGIGSNSWVKVIDSLAGAGYKVICPDFPGFGKSQNPPVPWSVNDYVNWLINFINYLEIDKFYLAGHSFGGRIAVKLSADYPEKVEKMVLISPAGIKMKFSLKTALIKMVSEYGKFIFNFKYIRVFREASRDIFYLFLRKKDYIRADGLMRETMKKVIEEDLSFCLPKINAKTLIIWGEKDKVIPLEYSAQFKADIRGSELKILDKIGHSPHIEIPERLSQIIIIFFNS